MDESAVEPNRWHPVALSGYELSTRLMTAVLHHGGAPVATAPVFS
jgi:hypothetical protein